MTQTMQFMACGSQMVRPVLFLAIFFNDSSLLLLFSGLGILSLKCISDVLLLKRFFPIFPKCNGTFCKIFYHFGMWIVEEQLKNGLGSADGFPTIIFTIGCWYDFLENWNYGWIIFSLSLSFEDSPILAQSPDQTGNHPPRFFLLQKVWLES